MRRREAETVTAPLSLLSKKRLTGRCVFKKYVTVFISVEWWIVITLKVGNNCYLDSAEPKASCRAAHYVKVPQAQNKNNQDLIMVNL